MNSLSDNILWVLAYVAGGLIWVAWTKRQLAHVLCPNTGKLHFISLGHVAPLFLPLRFAESPPK